MGQKVDSSSNVVHGDFVLCANCGREDDVHPDGFQGHAPVDYAEDNWIDVGRKLTCSIYCAAKVADFSEEEAQIARAKKTQADLRKAGDEEAADRDAEYVQALAERNEDFPYAPPLDAVADESDHPHNLTVEASEDDIDSEWEEIRKALEGSDS